MFPRGFETSIRHRLVSTTRIDRWDGAQETGVQWVSTRAQVDHAPAVLEVSNGILVARDDPVGGRLVPEPQLLTTPAPRAVRPRPHPEHAKEHGDVAVGMIGGPYLGFQRSREALARSFARNGPEVSGLY